MSALYFARTAEGQAAAYDASSAMPRKLRSLLKVIDGKTSNAVFAESLRAFGDVQGLLTSLQKAGLIEERQVAAEGAVANAVEPKSHHAYKRPKAAAEADGFAQTLSVHTQSPTVPGAKGGRDAGLAEQRQIMMQQDLQLLVQDMSSFVLAYVPLQAFSVLTELEQISTMEQMAVLLGGYELMVRDAGEPARIHLKHVRQILGNWL